MPEPFQFQTGARLVPDFTPGATHVIPQRRLGRLLAFAGKTIDDVVNCRVAHRELALYFKIDRDITRRTEILELENQWNPLGRIS